MTFTTSPLSEGRGQYEDKIIPSSVMTPTAPLSAQEQIEYLATKVMEWKDVMGNWSKMASGLTDCENCKYMYGKHEWNPLTDWNHWRQVEEKVMEDEDLSLVWVRLLTKELSMTMWDAVWRADLPTRVAALIQAHKELSPPQK